MRLPVLIPVTVFLAASLACGGDAAMESPAPPPKSHAEDMEKVAPEAPADAAGLPEVPVPADNPQSEAKVALGHALFMDKRLSFDGSRSCYSCHQNSLGNADGRALALGAGDKPLTRNTPTIWNVAYHRELYWDGRADSLEKQALGAWKGGNMGVGADNLDAKAAEIGALPEYAPAFAAEFGVAEGVAVTPMQVAQAISAYERTLLCGDPPALSERAQVGKALFEGKAGCVACHNGPALSDGQYHDIGLAHDASGALLEGADVGRAKVTGDEADTYKLRTPSLRNVGRTAPYFHDGRAATLEEAVRYMAGGGNPAAPGNSAVLSDKGLSDDDIAALVAYLELLTCGSLVEIGNQGVPGITN